MANPNGTSMVGGSAPGKPNAGINIPAITGTKMGKAKRGKGTRGKSFKNAQGTKSGVMRNPS